MSEKGRIIASVAGDYRIATDGGSFITCKARGLFRLKKISPCVGDYVTLAEENGEYVISEIAERKNMLVRPPLANLDCAVIVVSSCQPKPNPLVIDRLTVIFDSKGIESVLVFSKTDINENTHIDVYEKAGFCCLYSDNTDGIISRLSGKTSALIGNTGVGKTTLLNKLLPDLDLPTAAISKKLGRGKHTTRTVELHRLSADTYIADTPGFSTVESRFYGEIASDNVVLHFREIAALFERCKCKFTGCTHKGEDGCAVCAAVDDGVIPRSRYDSYVTLYNEARTAEDKW